MEKVSDIGKGVNILIAEREIIIALDIKKLLEKHGYRVLNLVTSVEAVIDCATVQKPHLVIMDIGLRGVVDDISAVNQIQHKNNIPFLYLTSYRNDEIRERATVDDKTHFLEKPFTEIELISAVGRIYDASRSAV